MYCPSQLVILSSLLACLRVSKGTVISENFVLDRAGILLTKEPLDTSQARSELECAIKCVGFEDCGFLLFNATQKTCKLFTNGDGETIPEVGWISWKIIRACPADLGYLLDTDTKLCYRLSGVSDLASHDTAENNCNNDGARLIVLDDVEKFYVVHGFLESLGSAAYVPGVPLYRIWVGMAKHNSVFVWSNGNDYVEVWQPGEPDWDLDQDCVQLLSAGLSDNYCHMSRRYLCEIPM